MAAHGDTFDAGAPAKSSPEGRAPLVSNTRALPEYLTAADVAEMLKVSVKSVFRWAHSDPSFPCLPIGGGTLRFGGCQAES